MKIDLEFRDLRSLISRMGAPQSEWTVRSTQLDPMEGIQRELDTGKEVPLEDVENTGGLLTYKGEQIVLYIMDTRRDRDTLLYDKRGAVRFHVAECKTLEDMREKGREERYIATTRKDGQFSVTATDPITKEVEELVAELGVCMNCMRQINWRGCDDLKKAARWKLWEAFTIEDFFAEYSTFFHHKPKHTELTAPLGSYVHDWAAISERIRAERNWTCEGCGVKLNEKKQYLYCHHLNGVITDNRSKNLQALCLICHSEQPAHSWLKPSQTARSHIEKLRVAQKLKG